MELTTLHPVLYVVFSMSYLHGECAIEMGVVCTPQPTSGDEIKPGLVYH